MFCTNLLLLRRTPRKTKDSLVGVGRGSLSCGSVTSTYSKIRFISKSSGNLGTTDQGVMTRSLPTSLLEAIHVSGCKEFCPWPVVLAGYKSASFHSEMRREHRGDLIKQFIFNIHKGAVNSLYLFAFPFFQNNQINRKEKMSSSILIHICRCHFKAHITSSTP